MKHVMKIIKWLFFIYTVFRGIINRYIKPAILFLEGIKILLHDVSLEDLHTDIIREQLKKALGNYYYKIVPLLNAYVSAVIKILPENAFADTDHRKLYEVVKQSIKYMYSIKDSKIHLSAILMQIATLMFIDLYDKPVKTSEANLLVQNTYTYLKYKNKLRA